MQGYQSPNGAAAYRTGVRSPQSAANTSNPALRAEHRERLRRFYEKVNPAKLAQLDEILDSFAGTEDEMFAALEAKYKVSTQLPGRVEQHAAASAQQQRQSGRSNANANDDDNDATTQHGPFGNTISMLNREQTRAYDASRAPRSYPVPGALEVEHFTADALPQLQRSLAQVQEAYSKLAESIAVSNANGVDLSRTAPWVVSAQLGASSFIAGARQFLGLAIDEERRMTEVHATLTTAAHAKAAAASAAGGGGFAAMNRASSTRVVDGSGVGKVVDITTPLGAATRRRQEQHRVVFDVSPLGGERHVVSDLLHSHAHAGDLIILHPGTYLENIVLRHDVEIRVASTAGGGSAAQHQQQHPRQASLTAIANLGDGAAAKEVLFLPADPSMPTIQVVGETQCTISGIHFAKVDRHGAALVEAATFSAANAGAHQDGVPHISLTGHSRTIIEHCTFTAGGGGVVCVGNAKLQSTMSLFRGCAFAAVYAKDASFVELVDVRLADCEVGVRARDAVLSMLRSEVLRAAADGVVLHGAAQAELERVVVTDCGGNGVLLSSASELALTDCRLVQNGKWGVEAPRGADFAVVRGMLVRNASGPMSRQPTQRA